MFTPFAFVKSTAVAPVAAYFLDTYSGASRAYSVRRLSSTYSGAAIRVRRTNDNSEQDIGFVGEDLDTSALATFVGANTGKVVTWYDQSGNGKDATSSDIGTAPTIRSGGTTETIGTKTAMDGANCILNFESISVTNNTQIIVGKRSAAGTNMLGFAYTTGGSPLLTHYSDNNFYFQWSGYYVNSSATNSSADQEVILGSTTSASTAVIERNGANIALASPVSFGINQDLNCIMKYGGVNGSAKYQELILYPSQQNANFTGMQTNINAYYSIY